MKIEPIGAKMHADDGKVRIDFDKSKVTIKTRE
jgi:hypothetical protein